MSRESLYNDLVLYQRRADEYRSQASEYASQLQAAREQAAHTSSQLDKARRTESLCSELPTHASTYEEYVRRYDSALFDDIHVPEGRGSVHRATGGLEYAALDAHNAAIRLVEELESELSLLNRQIGTLNDQMMDAYRNADTCDQSARSTQEALDGYVD